MKIKRGDIFLADLGEGYGSEQGGIRPVLVVQNNKGNKHSHTLLVACITSKAHSKHYLPTHYIIPKSFGLNYDSMVMMEQIKVIDETRIIKYIGKLTPRFMKILDKKLMISFGLIFPKNKTSKARRDKRRANWKMTAPNLVKCSKCGALMMPHRVCKACGSYNKKEVIAMDAE